MQTTRSAAVLCALIILPVLGPPASAQQTAPDGSDGRSPGGHYDASWPVTLTQSPKGNASGWSQQDIDEARTRCAAMLKDLDLVAVPADPIHEGEACGSPAPMKLVSVGSSPPIAFSPPAILTCDMIAALHKWLQRDVQSLARKHLGAPVVSLKVMSSYSCRNAYGRAKGKLSEHGRVNAIDIGELLTAQGETTMVVADWGPIARETGSKVTAEQADAIKRQAEAAANARKGKAAEETKVASPSTPKILQGGIQVGIPGLTKPAGTDTGFGFGPPSRLGGPKMAEAPSATDLTAKATFLRAIHKAACTIFSTVLGPEANSAHKNHFHLDMARRTSGSVCE